MNGGAELNWQSPIQLHLHTSFIHLFIKLLSFYNLYIKLVVGLVVVVVVVVVVIVVVITGLVIINENTQAIKINYIHWEQKSNFKTKNHFLFLYIGL